MTTRREITEWCRHFIQRHPSMVQVRHILLFAPVHHMMRSIQFLNSSNRNAPNIHWSIGPMFMPPNLLDQFGDEIPSGQSNWPDFNEKLDRRGEVAITEYLAPHETIDDFLRIALTPKAFFFGDFRFFPRQHAIVRAALGRFNEAAELLAEPLAKLEANVTRQMEEGRHLVGKRAKSAAGHFLLESGTRDAELAGDLRALLSSVNQRDAAAIAALLHRWELQNVRKWGVEQHWQPTPFPFETR